MPSHRIQREKKTVQQMIRLYCQKHHHTPTGLCPQCQALLTYSHHRLDMCKFGATKPVCGNCPVHCYKPDLRAQIQQVMRYAGPRMLTKHPVLAIQHLLDRLTRKPTNK